MDRLVLTARPRTPFAASLARLRTLVSRYTGIVRASTELLRGPDEAWLFHCACEATDGAGLVGHPIDAHGGGIHALREGALAAAIGEVAERYAASFLPNDRLILAVARALDSRAVGPERFALFRDDQYARAGFPFVPFTGDTPVRWVQGYALPDGEPVYLPAQLVYLDDSLVPGECRVGFATSTGLACAGTPEEAILSGLLEAVERDAFMLTWHNRLSLPLLTWQDDQRLTEQEQRYFAPAGLRHTVVDLSVFLQVPTALALVRGERHDPLALCVGAASAPTMQEAWWKALREAYQTRAWIRAIRSKKQAEDYAPTFEDIRTFEDHVTFYSYHRHAPYADFLDRSPRRTPVEAVLPIAGETAAELIIALCERLARHGLRAYTVDVTSPDIRQAGLSVMKVIVPELCPLDVSYTARYLGGHRLYMAAYEAGLRARPLAPDEINPYPHPFP